MRAEMSSDREARTAPVPVPVPVQDKPYGVDVQRTGELTVLKLSGRCDLACRGELTRVLGSLLALGHLVEVDLGEVTVCDRQGLAPLAEHQVSRHERGLPALTVAAYGPDAALVDELLGTVAEHSGAAHAGETRLVWPDGDGWVLKDPVRSRASWRGRSRTDAVAKAKRILERLTTGGQIIVQAPDGTTDRVIPVPPRRQSQKVVDLRVRRQAM